MLPINYDKTIYSDVVVMTMEGNDYNYAQFAGCPGPVLVLIPAAVISGGISPGDLQWRQQYKWSKNNVSDILQLQHQL